MRIALLLSACALFAQSGSKPNQTLIVTGSYQPIPLEESEANQASETHAAFRLGLTHVPKLRQHSLIGIEVNVNWCRYARSIWRQEPASRSSLCLTSSVGLTDQSYLRFRKHGGNDPLF
jgi:hypothetical protein